VRQINFVIIHCADTPADMDIGAEEIRRWHVEERGFSDIAYHHVIRRDGTVEPGRDERRIGAHAYGRNEDSIGVCMVGGKPDCNFTAAQWASLERLVRDLLARYPFATVIGHRDVSSKTCPNFDVFAWAQSL
jgi:N-acetyl-anhydromuramyl-L-alanine amidase AmpD